MSIIRQTSTYEFHGWCFNMSLSKVWLHMHLTSKTKLCDEDWKFWNGTYAYIHDMRGWYEAMQSTLFKSSFSYSWFYNKTFVISFYVFKSFRFTNAVFKRLYVFWGSQQSVVRHFGNGISQNQIWIKSQEIKTTTKQRELHTASRRE